MDRSAILPTSMAVANSPRSMSRSMHRSLQHSRSANWFVPSITRHPNAYYIFTSQKVLLVRGLRTYTTWQTSEACSTRTTRTLSSARTQRNTNHKARHQETIMKASLSKHTVAIPKPLPLCSSRCLTPLETLLAQRASQTQPTFLPADTALRFFRIS